MVYHADDGRNIVVSDCVSQYFNNVEYNFNILSVVVHTPVSD